jgi:hypothetical protein
MITITQATISDSATLSKLAIARYQENYLYLWHEGGAEWYMKFLILSDCHCLHFHDEGSIQRNSSAYKKYYCNK